MEFIRGLMAAMGLVSFVWMKRKERRVNVRRKEIVRSLRLIFTGKVLGLERRRRRIRRND